MGDVDLSLHPDQFVDANWTDDKPVRLLKFQMGSVQIDLRTRPAAPPAENH